MINIPHTITAIKVKHMHKSLQDWGQNMFLTIHSSNRFYIKNYSYLLFMQGPELARS